MSDVLASDEILWKYAAGSLDSGLRLLVDAHLDLAPQARTRLEAFERAAGAAFASEAPTAMRPDALDRTLDALSDARPTAPRRKGVEALALGRSRWAGRGGRITPVRAPGSNLKLFLVSLEPGRAMLPHGHRSREWTVILRGRYRDEDGLHVAGDFIEEDADCRHRPAAEGDETCVCLIALEGGVDVRGAAGALATILLR